MLTHLKQDFELIDSGTTLVLASNRFGKFKQPLFCFFKFLHYVVGNYIRGSSWIFHGRRFSDRTCFSRSILKNDIKIKSCKISSG